MVILLESGGFSFFFFFPKIKVKGLLFLFFFSFGVYFTVPSCSFFPSLPLHSGGRNFCVGVLFMFELEASAVNRG